MKRRIKVWVVAVCVLALALLVLELIQWSGETVAFEIVDYVTGKPIRGATVEVSRIRTNWPVAKLSFLGIKQWHRRTIVAETGIVKINDIPNRDLSCRIVVRAKGYAE